MGGNGVQNAQQQVIVCEFHGVTPDADVERLGAEIRELMRRRAASGVVREARAGHLEIEAELEGNALEALRLEIRRLARRYGRDVARVSLAARRQDAAVERA